MTLTNKKIVITGGTSGIGKEFAVQLSKENSVMIVGRNAERLAEISKTLNVKSVKADVSQTSEVTKLAQEVKKEFGTFDILINSAGVMLSPDFKSENAAIMAQTEIDTNINGTVQTSLQLLKLMNSNGTIVTISSGLKYFPMKQFAVYSATKIPVHYFSQTLRAQLKPNHIQVMELVPPLTKTPLQPADAKNFGPVMPVEVLVRRGIKGIEKGKKRVVPGMSKVLRFIGKIAPNAMLNL